MGINVLELSGGVTIYGHGDGVPRYLMGMFIRGTERRLVTLLIIFFCGVRPAPDYGADLSLVLQPARYD